MKHNNRIYLPGFLIICMLFMVFFSEQIAPHDPNNVQTEVRLKLPSWDYPMGTDHMGRCIFSRVVYGSRISILLGVTIVALSASIGTILGFFAGYFGGIVDEILMRIVDAFLTIPSMFLALAIIGFMGTGFFNLVLSISAVEWTAYARLVRGLVISLKDKDFIDAARCLGASELYIFRYHIIAIILPHVLVMAALGIGYAILGAASMSFLGLGVQPPTPEWGAMMNDGRYFVRSAPHIMIFPGIFITICVLSFNLIGEWMRDNIDPKLKYMYNIL